MHPHWRPHSRPPREGTSKTQARKIQNPKPNRNAVTHIPDSVPLATAGPELLGALVVRGAHLGYGTVDAASGSSVDGTSAPLQCKTKTQVLQTQTKIQGLRHVAASAAAAAPPPPLPQQRPLQLRGAGTGATVAAAVTAS